MNTSSDILLLQFAKAPKLGKVKTRLHTLSDFNKLRVHERLTKVVWNALLAFCRNKSRLDLHLWITEKSDFFFSLTGVEFDTIFLQKPGDLGQKLSHAFYAELSKYEKVIVVGSDCPFLSQAYLESAVDALDNTDCVIGPAKDGGYVLIGLREHYPNLFEGIPWGTRDVLGKTLDRVAACDIRLKILDSLHDIDRPQDLSLIKNLLGFKDFNFL